MNKPALKEIVSQFFPPDPPYQKARQRHLAAAITGYVFWACLIIFAAMVLFSAGATLLGRGGGYTPEFPFDGRTYAVTGKHLLLDEQSYRSLTGDGATFQVWRIDGSKGDLTKSLDREITNSRVWFHRPFNERDKKVMEFVSVFPEYYAASSYTKEATSGDFYFSYEHLRIYDDGRVGDAGIWIFNPDKMLLVYLNGNI